MDDMDDYMDHDGQGMAEAFVHDVHGVHLAH